MPVEKESRPTLATLVIIDDDPNLLELTSLILSRRGFQVFAACTPRAGLELIAAHSPELVLLDYVMPEMNGLDTLRQIKSQFPDTYVVMFTGKGSEEIAVELMKSGASEYLLKPFNNRNLIERLENVLKVREVELHNRILQREQERLLREIETWNQELQNRVREKTEALHNAQDEIVQSEKLAALGYLAAGMAHEIRNPLNSISLFIQLMRQNSDDPEQREYQGKILKEVERVDAIIRKLLDVSRRTRVITSNVLINRVIDAALDVFAPQIETRNIIVERNYTTLPAPITADAAELEQIFTNLFLNALDEMTQGGRLVIEITQQDSRVIIRVSDSGGGIPESALPNIFEPFYSTKSRGTGMGLPVAQRIARMYEGLLTVEETSSLGTIFRLEFPISR
ncbi:MAG TPA: response regulator [Desulfuromonadales bacterium]|nr:response regulator [Desulfuromonadales bacterium]